MQRLIMCRFYFLVISKCFVIFLNKLVKQKIPNEEILRTAINLNTHFLLVWLLYTKCVRDSTREKMVSEILLTS